MMREIKFRAWDKLNKKYFENDHRAFAGSLEILQIGLNGRLSLLTSFYRKDESLFPDRFIIQQYTGLKDLNGTEIYEGDIIWDAHAEIHGKVTFDEGMFCVEWETHIEHLFEVVIDGYAEVLGNIYKNPELLGDNQ